MIRCFFISILTVSALICTHVAHADGGVAANTADPQPEPASEMGPIEKDIEYRTIRLDKSTNVLIGGVTFASLGSLGVALTCLIFLGTDESSSNDEDDNFGDYGDSLGNAVAFGVAFSISMTFVVAGLAMIIPGAVMRKKHTQKLKELRNIKERSTVAFNGISIGGVPNESMGLQLAFSF